MRAAAWAAAWGVWGAGGEAGGGGGGGAGRRRWWGGGDAGQAATGRGRASSGFKPGSLSAPCWGEGRWSVQQLRERPRSIRALHYKTFTITVLQYSFICLVYHGLLFALRTMLIIGSNHLISQPGWNSCNISTPIQPHKAGCRCGQDIPWQIPEDETVCINTKKDKPMSQ